MTRKTKADLVLENKELREYNEHLKEENSVLSTAVETLGTDNDLLRVRSAYVSDRLITVQGALNFTSLELDITKERVKKEISKKWEQVVSSTLVSLVVGFIVSSYLFASCGS